MPIPRTEHLSSGGWRVVATVGSRRRTKVFPTEGEALVWADTEMRRVAKASSATVVQPVGKPVFRLADYVPVYLASRSLEPGTISNYRAHLRPVVAEFGAWPLDAGLRWAEVYGMHASSVNTLRRRIDVSDVLARPDFEPRPYPKGKLTRSVPTTARLTKALTEYLEDPPEDGGPTACPDPRCHHGLLLFSSPTRTAMNYHQWKSSFQAVVRAAHLAPPQPTFHKLRHTFGTRLAEVGTPPEEIAALMGHASTETTRIYTHAAGPKTSEAWLRFALEGAPSPVESIMKRRAR